MNDLFRRLFRGRRGPDSRDSAEATASHTETRDRRAFHECIFSTGLPTGVPPPPYETQSIAGHREHVLVVTNVFVPILAAPGVGVRSLINRVRFGDINGLADEHYLAGPPRYLCDGAVYALGLGALPLPHLMGSGFAVDSQRMAVIIAYAVDDAASLEVAKDLHGRLVVALRFKEKSGASFSFAAMLLGLRADPPDHVAPDNQHPESEELRKKARSFASDNKLSYAECSARTGWGVLEALGVLVERIGAPDQTESEPEQTFEEKRDEWISAVAKVAETARAGVKQPRPVARNTERARNGDILMEAEA